MRLEDVRSVALLGAGGKMGSEIALLLVELMAERGAVICIDASPDRLEALKRGLNGKWVECTTSLEALAGADLIFEAVDEDLETKKQLLRAAGKLNPRGYFFTTTSAIPISEIDRSSELNGRIIGFHFFNPPTRQQLIELIAPDEMEPELTPLALGIAREMKKKTLFSADVAGFVSNGHFMREIRYACDEAEEMAQEHGVAHAVAIINDVTRDLLVRPMGIFEVMDYVGVGVCRQIGLVMNQFLPGSDFSNDLVDQVAEGPGSFFQYEKRVPKAVYDVDHRAYVPMPRHDWGKLPNWSQLRESRQGRETLQIFFKHLFEELSPQAEIARDYLLESREIAQQLVRDGVARDLEDVNRVLQLGFGHLYGPQNDLY